MNIFPRPEIPDVMKHFIMLQFCTEGPDADGESNQKGRKAPLEVRHPHHAVLEADEKPRSCFAGLAKDPVEFAALL